MILSGKYRMQKFFKNENVERFKLEEVVQGAHVHEVLIELAID